ncbi:MAG: hypothetical protein QW727_00810 [Candidatus Pacearchaeota archaeon]
MIKSKNKRGQTTIFVILAVVIVAVIVIFFAVTDIGRETFEKISNIVGSDEINVKEELNKCFIDNSEINKKINLIMSQGGSIEPSLFFLHNGTKLSYLCYTNEFYKTCVNQQPLILQHTKNEINRAILPEIDKCISSLKANFEKRGYQIRGQNFESSIDIIHNNIIIKINFPLTIKKGDLTQTFENFEIKKHSQYYQLLSVATSIVNFESQYGDSDPVLYMSLYPNTRVEKLKQGDGTTIYKISDRETMETFNFAVRSLALPIGYGL